MNFRPLIVPTTLAILTMLLITSCGNEVAQKMESKGTALGKMNEIVVIADDNVWEGPIGDTLRFYFESAYPILPAPEPLFDLRHFTPTDLKVQPIRKELRTYIILADVDDLDSETTQMVRKDVGSERLDYPKDGKPKVTSVGKDKWARGQLLVYLYGRGEKQLSEAIVSSFSAIAKRINQHDSKQLKAGLYVEKVNLGLTARLKDQYGLDLPIPRDFETAVENAEDRVLWLRKNTKKADLHLVVMTVPYTDKKQLQRGNILALRDEFGSKYLTMDSKTDVMVVDSINLPVYEYPCNIDGTYGKELRGIWKLTESWVGGPFTSYMILNEKRSELIFVDVFVQAPGTKKRDLMMQLNHMVKTAKVVS